MTVGDVQWMTEGRGILHQEMPKGDSRGRMHGFQLWANLPANLNDRRHLNLAFSRVYETPLHGWCYPQGCGVVSRDQSACPLLSIHLQVHCFP